MWKHWVKVYWKVYVSFMVDKKLNKNNLKQLIIIYETIQLKIVN